MSRLPELLDFVSTQHGINDKAKLAALIVEKFCLTQDRSVYYCADFAIRFSSGAGSSFSNTVLSLSNLKKVDSIPFLVCLVTPTENHILLANSTLLRKISHSSQQLVAWQCHSTASLPDAPSRMPVDSTSHLTVPILSRKDCQPSLWF